MCDKEDAGTTLAWQSPKSYVSTKGHFHKDQFIIHLIIMYTSFTVPRK